MLEQITTDYDIQEPTPKGMVRTEMGKLVKKEDQDAWDDKMVKSMNKEYFSRGKKEDIKKRVGAKIAIMKKLKK